MRPAEVRVFEFFEPVVQSGLQGFFAFLAAQPIALILLTLAIGYPVGRRSLAGVSLGTTAGTLLTGVLLSVAAQVGFGIAFSIPAILSSLFLLLFMYALGLKVGPQFFAGLRSGGFAFVGIALVVWVLNWLICVVGAKLVGLAPGYGAGLISGSYTITAVMGVAQSAIQSGAFQPPPGTSADQVAANIAGAYAVSYVLSSVGIILLIRYLPRLFGHDAVADAKAAEKAFSGGATHAVPGSAGALDLGFSFYDLRAYHVEHDAIVGQTAAQLFARYPQAPVLRVVRAGQVLDLATATIARGDVVTVRANVHELILKEGEVIGPESDDAVARNLPLEVADVHVGAKTIAGQSFEALGRTAGFGIQAVAWFRAGQELPIGPKAVLQRGDVVRVSGPDTAVRRFAQVLGGRPILASTSTEVTYMALAMVIGYLVGVLTVTLGGIPFSLGTSAGCILMGIAVSYLRSRNPELGGPVSEGARSFMQDIGLNLFVAVLAANVGPKVISSFQGDTALWLALLGTTAALVPPLLAYVIGVKCFKLNSVICAGACAGARNNTASLNAIVDESRSSIAAVPYPVGYALTSVLALIGGYFAMLLA